MTWSVIVLTRASTSGPPAWPLDDGGTAAGAGGGGVCRGNLAGTPCARRRAVGEQLGMDEHLRLRAGVAIALAKQAVAAEVAVLEAAGQARVGDAEIGLELDELGGLGVIIVIN